MTDTKQPTDSIEALRRLDEWLVEDILSLSDEEVCAELRADGIDPEAAATAWRARVEAIIRQAKDRRESKEGRRA